MVVDRHGTIAKPDIAAGPDIPLPGHLLAVHRPGEMAARRQLHLLEVELGAPLLDRIRLGMSLSPAGRILAEHARRAIAEMSRPSPRSAPISDRVS